MTTDGYSNPAPTMGRLLRGQPILLALAFVVFLAVMALDIWLTKRVAFDAQQVEHSLQNRNKLANLRLLLRRSESRQLGHLLTNDARYLTDYQDDVEKIAPALDELAPATSDNPRQRDFLAVLQPTVNAKLEEMRETISHQRSGDMAGALALIRTDRGRTLMEDASTLIGSMESEEQRLLSLRIAASDLSNRWLLMITISGIAVIFVLAAASVLLLRRSLKQQQDAYSALDAANQGLETTVAERTARLSEANEEIQRFAYIVSHDLRSPLVNIMGFTGELDAWQKQMFERIETLRAQVAGDKDGASDETLRGDVEEALSFIKSSIAKMDRLIGAILKLSREGQRRFQPQLIDMSQLLQTILEALAHQVQDVDAKISIGKLPAITSDRLALEQVFSNLVDNALKYFRAGAPGNIEVRATEANGAITYEVHDNGRGIDQRIASASLICSGDRESRIGRAMASASLTRVRLCGASGGLSMSTASLTAAPCSK